MRVHSIISALLLDGQGNGVAVAEEDILRWTAEQGTLWLHVDYSHGDANAFLTDKCGIDGLIVDALSEEGTQPRCFISGDNLFLVLRGLNLNPDADLLDMVSIRVWVEQHRIVTMRRRKVMAVEDIRSKLEQGTGPTGSEAFVVQLCENLSDRMEVALSDMEEQEDALEALTIEGETYKLRSTLSGLRRRIITMRRYLAPQRQALAHLQAVNLSWLSGSGKAALREVADRTARDIDDLDAVRDRAAVAQDELESRLAEQTNKNMYLLSIVAAVFLPLGLLTGLLGINVLGIPGAANPHAFYIVCAMLLLIAAFEIWLFKARKLL